MSTAQNKIAGAPIWWGVCECLAGATSFLRIVSLPRCARSAWPLPSSDARASFPPSRKRWPTCCHDTGCTRSAGSPHCCYTAPITNRCGTDVMEVLERGARPPARTLGLSADSELAGYDTRPTLDEQRWATLLANLDRIDAVAAEHDVRAVLHPHVGTMIENGDEVQRVLGGSSISLCLDTGHLLIGGTDPAELTRQVPERIGPHTREGGRPRPGTPGAVRAAHVHPRRSVTHVPPARQRGCRCRWNRGAPAQAGLRRLVRPRAGHHPQRGTPRRGSGGRRTQRGVLAEGDHRQRMIASTSRRGSAERDAPAGPGPSVRPPRFRLTSALIPGWARLSQCDRRGPPGGRC